MTNKTEPSTEDIYYSLVNIRARAEYRARREMHIPDLAQNRQGQAPPYSSDSQSLWELAERNP